MTTEETIILARQYALEVKKALDLLAYEEIAPIVDAIVRCKERDGTVYTAGNGGSAATASHFANDLVKSAGVKAFSMPDMTSMVSAYGNDIAWDNMYWEFLHDFYRLASDLIIVFSCSGRSENVITCLHIPDEHDGAILFTGNDAPEDTKHQAGFVLEVPHDDIRIQEDVHLMICHIIAGLVRDAT